MFGMNGIFDTIATVGTASAVSEPAKFPVDMQPKPIGGPVVGPAVPPPTQGEQTQMAQGLILLLSSSRAVKPEAAQQLAFAIAAVCGPSSALTPAQQGQAVNQILSSSTAVDKAQVPTLYGLVSMFIGQQPVAARRAARRERGRKVIGESIFGNYLFANDALPQQVEQPWALPTEPSADQPEPVGPRGMSGFGTDVPVDHSIPTGMKWLGHGIMGGRTRHGGYGVSRYGEPVTGYGAFGYSDVRDPTMRQGDSAGSKSADGLRSCAFLGRSNSWSPQWACNDGNFSEFISAYNYYISSIAGTYDTNDPRWQTAMKNLGIQQFYQQIEAGSLPSPPGFPKIAKPPVLPPAPAPTPLPPAPVPQFTPTPPPLYVSPVQPPAPIMQVATTESNTKLFVGIGAAVLALGAAGLILSTGKKPASKAA
jgi:hypothetical protein